MYVEFSSSTSHSSQIPKITYTSYFFLPFANVSTLIPCLSCDDAPPKVGDAEVVHPAGESAWFKGWECDGVGTFNGDGTVEALVDDERGAPLTDGIDDIARAERGAAPAAVR